MFSEIVNTAEECELLGKKISSKLIQGDIVSLEGELGSGKTTFVKGILKSALGHIHS